MTAEAQLAQHAEALTPPPSPTGLTAFLSSAPARRAYGGNSSWADRYADKIRRVFHEHAARAPRSLQSHLGPSEIGVECDRQVVGKLAGFPTTNHVADPWPSIRGTALHTWAEGALEADNARQGRQAWYPERKVTPFDVRDHHEGHRGTADALDVDELAVVDWKFLGEGSMAKIRDEPPRKYRVQLKLYARGYIRAGFPVRRVVIVAVPATAASLDGLYVWEHVLTADDAAELEAVEAQLEHRKWMASVVAAGQAGLSDVPAVPSDTECYFCLAGETEVVTRQGIRPIRELAGGEAELLIPSDPRGSTPAASKRGEFRSVPVRALGEQRLYTVNLRRYRATKTVHATAEHRWILPDGSVRTTVELTGGDRLASVRAQPFRRGDRIPVAVAQGFTYGDGTRGQGRRPATLSIYDRSTADEHVVPFFGPVRTKRYATPDGDKVTHIYGLPRFWKEVPPLDESRSFLISWLAGYFAADGSVTEKGQATISSADRGSLEFVRDLAAVCGIGHGVIRERERVGTGTEPTALYAIDLVARDLPAWFWVLPHQAETVAARLGKPERTTHWHVESVEITDRVEEVFCATVPEVEAFGLADGLTTGNCPFYRPQAAKDGGTGCPGNAPPA